MNLKALVLHAAVFAVCNGCIQNEKPDRPLNEWLLEHYSSIHRSIVVSQNDAMCLSEETSCSECIRMLVTPVDIAAQAKHLAWELHHKCVGSSMPQDICAEYYYKMAYLISENDAEKREFLKSALMCESTTHNMFLKGAAAADLAAIMEGDNLEESLCYINKAVEIYASLHDEMMEMFQGVYTASRIKKAIATYNENGGVYHECHLARACAKAVSVSSESLSAPDSQNVDELHSGRCEKVVKRIMDVPPSEGWGDVYRLFVRDIHFHPNLLRQEVIDMQLETIYGKDYKRKGIRP